MKAAFGARRRRHFGRFCVCGAGLIAFTCLAKILHVTGEFHSAYYVMSVVAFDYQSLHIKPFWYLVLIRDLVH